MFSKIVSHRGNLSGPDPDKENSPESIKLALNMGFLVEVDIQRLDFSSWKAFLGHDKSRYEVSLDFLIDKYDRIICHLKYPEDYLNLMHVPSKWGDKLIGLTFFFNDKDYVTPINKLVAMRQDGPVWESRGLWVWKNPLIHKAPTTSDFLHSSRATFMTVLPEDADRYREKIFKEDDEIYFNSGRICTDWPLFIINEEYNE